MRAHIDLKGTNHRWARKLNRWSLRLKKLSELNLSLVNGDQTFNFKPKSKTHYGRYIGLLDKEPGTIKWLEKLEEGDVFYDIGANLGLYSIYAAKLNKNVKVFSFEPHKPNFATLIENIFSNNVQSHISPISIPLSNDREITKFNYYDNESGTSLSQLGHTHTEENEEFTPVLEEVVCSCTIDDLIEKEIIKPPNAIKIDVDGNELKILEGMENTLKKFSELRTIQIEIYNTYEEISDFLKKLGFEADHKHFTKTGQKKLESGISEDTIWYNVVYNRVN